MFRNKLVWVVCVLGLVCAWATGGAEADADSVQCLKSVGFLTPIDSPDYRKYAPDREVQMLHLVLDVTPDFKQRTLDGIATLKFAPVAKPVRQVKLDGIDLTIQDVSSSEQIRAYDATEKNLVITFEHPIPAGKETSVTVRYHAEPKAGIYFRTPEMGYKPGDTHLFSQGEEIEARNWYPCLDSPNQRFTSEVICHVPEGMTAISNGRLLSQTKDAATGLVAIHWSQEKSHANYLISLAAGYFKKIEGRYKEMPISFYTPASEIELAANSFRDTKDMLAFYEEEIGFPYAWPKYFQVCVNDFIMGGMENTSCTTLTDNTLFSDATENIRTSEGLVAHELAHQWFGDLVTCKDWSHIWLNESFATYYQTLYNAHKNGRDSMLYELYGRARQITGITNNFNSIVRRTYESSHDMFDYLAYPKGGWVLHMLRSQLGDELFRRCIKTYLERHQYGNVVTEDLREVIEELSGPNFDQFFEQWLYHGYHPELDVSYSWDEETKLAKVTIKQTQKVTEQVLLFNLPVAIRFKGKFGQSDHSIVISQKEEDFYFPLKSAPKIARFDPDYTLLAKVTFKLPRPMLFEQLKDSKDMIGRVQAIAQLAEATDKESVAKLKEALDSDPFYGARIEASRALLAIHTEEALQALLASKAQSDARVRRQVAADIGGFYDEAAYASSLKTIEREKNPDIVAAALASLPGYPKPEVLETLLRLSKSESLRNELAVNAIVAMRSQDDPAFIPPLMENLRASETNFTSRGLAQGLEALGYLGRNEEKKGKVREFLTTYANDPRERVQLASFAALGTLGDPAALPILEKFANASKENPQQAAAEKAVLLLRESRKPVDDFKNVRQEVLDLKKSNQDLSKKLEALEKKVQARGGTSTSSMNDRRSSGKISAPKAQ